MREPSFLTKEDVLGFHVDQICLFGGMPGIRDEGLLESSIAAPQQLYFYDENADIFDLAACYLSSLARNHPFFDGNKRTATQSSLAFLHINGLTLDIPNEWLIETVYNFLKQELNVFQLAHLLFLGCNHAPASSEFLPDPEDIELRRQYTTAKSKAERHALIVDHNTAKLRSLFIQRCEKFMIRSNRFDSFIQEVESEFFNEVEANFRRQFGMSAED